MPYPIMDLIFYKAYSQDIRSILQLRLVCKAWRVAFTYFGREARLTCMAGLELQQACKILLSLGNLSVKLATARNCITAIQPISSLSLLSRLGIENTGSTPLSNCLFEFVPVNLKALDLKSSSRESSFIQHVQPAGLTKVSLECGSFSTADIDALQHLPSLQVNLQLLITAVSRLQLNFVTKDVLIMSSFDEYRRATAEILVLLQDLSIHTRSLHHKPRHFARALRFAPTPSTMPLC